MMGHVVDHESVRTRGYQDLCTTLRRAPHGKLPIGVMHEVDDALDRRTSLRPFTALRHREPA